MFDLFGMSFIFQSVFRGIFCILFGNSCHSIRVCDTCYELATFCNKQGGIFNYESGSTLATNRVVVCHKTIRIEIKIVSMCTQLQKLQNVITRL